MKLDLKYEEIMYKNVLIPVMGKYTEEIIESALDLIDGREVELIALYVAEDSVPFLTPRHIKQEILTELKNRGEVFLNQFEKALDLETNNYITLKKEIVEGDPANLIVETAEKNNTDVIIMGTGKSIVDKHLLGSVSEKVVHLAPCTIHLVRTIEKIE